MAKSEAEFSRRAFEEIEILGRGEVVSYGEIARRAGSSKAAQSVGNVLHAKEDKLPWWRVVYADGSLVEGREAEHEEFLQREDVPVSPRNRVPSASFVKPPRRPAEVD